MDLEYNEHWTDIRSYIHPIFVTEATLISTLRLVNDINWYLKEMGRLYIDGDFNLVYSLRLPHDLLRSSTSRCFSEIKLAVQVFIDLFDLLVKIASGNGRYDDCKAELDLIWQLIFRPKLSIIG